jgi:hypothetical protein
MHIQSSNSGKSKTPLAVVNYLCRSRLRYAELGHQPQNFQNLILFQFWNYQLVLTVNVIDNIMLNTNKLLTAFASHVLISFRFFCLGVPT